MGRVVTRSMTRALAMSKVENYSNAAAVHPYFGDHNEAPMDPTVWSHLPEHLLDRILLHLAIPSIFRLRSVCKAWLQQLSSAPFLDLHDARRSCSSSSVSSPSPEPWFLVFRNQDYRDACTYIPALNRWVKIAPPTLVPDLVQPVPDSVIDGFQQQLQQMFLPIAGAGGRLCFSSCANGRTSLAVVNVMTKRWRLLPPMLRIQTYHMAGMAIDRRTGAYRIVVVGIYGVYDVYYPTTEVYTSETAAWTVAGDIPRGPLFPSRRTLLCGGILYSWCCDPPDGLVAYDMADGSWSQIQAPLRHSLEGHILTECRGGMYTVGGVRDNGGSGAIKSIRIWKLRGEELEWEEVDRMPQMLCEEFLSGGKRFVCIGSDGFVLLIVRARNRLSLLYDLRKRIWRRLPPCPLADHRLRYGLIDGISFEPRLNITV